MNALILPKTGDIDNLEYRDVVIPEPGEGEIRVNIKAAALNHRDVFICHALYPGIKLPCILGSDGAGIVDALDKNVPDNLLGQEVVLYPASPWGSNHRAPGPDYRVLGMPEPGTFSEYVCVHHSLVVKKPSSCTWSEAAALPLAGLTAWRSTVTQAKIEAGEKVLVTGAGGGVSSFAIRWAVKLGATVYVTSGSEEKVATLLTEGIAGGVNYKNEDWDKQLKDISGGGVDVVIDSTGGKNFSKCFDAVNPGGRIVFYGATAGDPPTPISLPRWFFKQVSIHGTTMGTEAEFAAMVNFADVHKIKPRIDSEFALSDGRAAFKKMAAGQQNGKIILIP